MPLTFAINVIFHAAHTCFSLLQSSLDGGEGEQAGVDKFVFVLSTHESDGRPLYGVCLYWDEPCYVLFPETESHDSKRSFSQKVPRSDDISFDPRDSEVTPDR